MSRTSILAILASVGVIFSGIASADAVAFARAVQSGEPDVLNRFAKQFPESEYRGDAIRLASCTVNWVGGICGGDTDIRGNGNGGGGGGINGAGAAPAPVPNEYAS